MRSRVVQSSVRLPSSALSRSLGWGGGGVAGPGAAWLVSRDCERFQTEEQRQRSASSARGAVTAPRANRYNHSAGGTIRSQGFASESAKQRHTEKKVGSGHIRVELLNPYQLHRLHDGPATAVFTSKEELLQMYRDMNVLRRMELTADMLFKSQQIRGFCHLYDGQEAISVGMEAALTYEDSVLTAYRDHGIFLGRGGTTFEAFSELMGKKTGCAIGKGGSMHLYKRENNYYGGWGIVGTSGPLGTGLAFALKYLKKPNVAVAIYGDGAANQGQLYEAQNCAALWDLPVIYLVENNHYGMGTAEWRASKKTTFFDRLSYIPGIKVDGMDAFSVKAAMLFAKDHCVAGKGPIVVECDTYRYHGHSMSDPGSTYRTRDEIQGFRKERDPIERIRNIILKEELSSAEELKKLDKEVRREVEEQAAKAREAPQPEEHELFSNIYRLDTGLVTYGCDRKDTIKLP